MSVEFHKLAITEINQETTDTISVGFNVPPELAEQFQFQPGQHLTIRVNISGEDIRRNYSLCTAPDEQQWKIAIKHLEGGIFSTWARNDLKVNDVVEVIPPHGSFILNPDSRKGEHYVAFAAGAGITPIISQLKAALSACDKSQFTLFYGNRDSSSVIFLEELARLKNKYMDRLQLFHILSRETEDIELFNGRLDSKKCDELLDYFVNVSEIAGYYVCGPSGMLDAVVSALKARDVAPEKIHVERFTAGIPAEQIAAAIARQSQKAAGASIKLTLDGRTRLITFDAKAGSILENVQASGLSAPYACKSGVCATCRAKLESGSVTMATHHGLTDEDIAAGYVLTCQAVPETKSVTLNYDL